MVLVFNNGTRLVIRVDYQDLGEWTRQADENPNVDHWEVA